jgi:hypothetical protein
MFFEDRLPSLPASDFRGSGRMLEGAWNPGRQIAGAAMRSNSYRWHKHISDTNIFFFFLFSFNNLPVFLAAGGRPRDYRGISRTAAVRAILTVKMPEEPIIIIIGGGLF